MLKRENILKMLSKFAVFSPYRQLVKIEISL
jgi:hypothetical protein